MAGQSVHKEPVTIAKFHSCYANGFFDLAKYVQLATSLDLAKKSLLREAAKRVIFLEDSPLRGGGRW